MDEIGRGKIRGFENINPLVEELKRSFPSSLLVYKFLDEVISLPFPTSDTDNTSDLPNSKLSQTTTVLNGVVMGGNDVPNNIELFGSSSTLSLSDILTPFVTRGNSEQDDDDPLCLQQQEVTSSSVHSSNVSNAYDILLDQLKRPESAGIVKSLQSFEAEFRLRSRLPDATTGTELGKAIQELIYRTMSQLRLLITSFSEWDVWSCALEKALETLLIHKLHDFAWGLVVDQNGDTFLSNRLCSLSFLSFEHFDMRALEENSSKWILAQAKLCEMNSMRTPCGKLACLKECLQLISEALEKTSPLETCEYGTDDFLPALILLVISANPPQLASNVEFLQCFHNPADLHNGEEGYMLTLLVSAIHFLKNADANILSIRPEDFEKCIEESMRVKQQKVVLERTTTSEIEKDNGMQGGIELVEEDELFNDTKSVKSTHKVMPLERVPELPLPHVEELKPSQVHLVKPVPSSRHRTTVQEQQPLCHSRYSNQQQSILSRLIFADKTVREIHPSDLPALLKEHHSLLWICNELLEEKEILGGGRHI